MTLIACDIGDRIIIAATLTDANGDPVTGATVTARALHNGTETDLGTGTDEGAGVYSFALEPDAAGTWQVRAEAAAPNKAAAEGLISVYTTDFTIA